MAEASSSSSSARTTVTNAKFEVEKFDGTNNFGMWQCEVLDVLCQQELDVAPKEKPDKYSVMRETSTKKLWKTLEEKYMKKSLENRLYMKKKLYRFTYTHGMSMNDHVNSFNKILTNLLNLDERFEDEDKVLLLLNFLPDEYDNLTTTLHRGKDNVTFDAVCSALYNSETKKKCRKDHRDTVAEALIARGRSQSRKPEKRSKSKGRPAKDEYAFCCEKRHWKKNCPKLQKGKAISDACVAEHDEESNFSLLQELDGGVVFMGNDNACKTMGIASTVSGKDADSEATKLWHMRLGHAGEKALQTLAKQDLLKGTNSCKLEFCEHCVSGKQTRVKFSSAIHDTKGILDYIHSDVWEPIKTASLGDEGIVRHFTVRDTLQQNRVAERMNQTILEKVRCILFNAGLGKEFWAEAVVEFEKVKVDPAGVDEMDIDSPSTEDNEEVLTQEPSQQQDSIAYRRPHREIRRLARFVDMVAYALPIVDDDVPSSYRKTINNPEITLPKENKAIGCKWVYVKKERFSRKNEIRYKARLVANGYAQKEGIYYNEVFSPVVKHSSIRILLAIVAQFDLELVQLDVKTVFLHGDLEEEIYMTQPDGFKVAGKENWVCKMTKSLYGLKQSPSIITSKSKYEIEKLKTQLNQEFKMKDLGEAKKILGMEICRDRTGGKISLSQKQYWKEVLQQFDAEREYILQVPYSNAVGSLMYAMVCTTPNISHAVSIVSRYMHNPSKRQWQAVKWILRYIQKTMDVSLLFERDDTLGQGVIGYVDSDYVGDLDKRRSTTGYVFTFAGGPISWKSTLQSTVALSTTEAEYMAIVEAIKEAIWLQDLLENLGLAQEHINVYCDS
ncbi:Integrase catalytic domain-containing protein [Citrus sinensis]|nr:Integrase catalytic domain-containing protein [Citrus sinensis]